MSLLRLIVVLLVLFAVQGCARTTSTSVSEVSTEEASTEPRVDVSKDPVEISTTVGVKTSANLIPVDLEFSESVESIDLTTLVVTGGEIADVSGSGKRFKVKIAPTDGVVSVQAPQGLAMYASGSVSPASKVLSVIYEDEGPVFGGCFHYSYLKNKYRVVIND